MLVERFFRFGKQEQASATDVLHFPVREIDYVLRYAVACKRTRRHSDYESDYVAESSFKHPDSLHSAIGILMASPLGAVKIS
jgi:hypothetical protein